MKRSLLAASATLAVAASPAAHANIIPPNGSGAPDVFASSPVDTGATLLATTSGSFSSSLSFFSGTFIEDVYRGNSLGANDLTFIFQVTNSASSTDDIVGVQLTSFAGFLTDVGYTTGTPPGGFSSSPDNPSSVFRTAASPITTDTVAFNFIAPAALAPGATSAILEIQTNTTAFAAGALTEISPRTDHATESGFAPTVPEPSAWAMMLIGFAGLAYAGLRSRKTAISVV